MKGHARGSLSLSQSSRAAFLPGYFLSQVPLCPGGALWRLPPPTRPPTPPGREVCRDTFPPFGDGENLLPSWRPPGLSDRTPGLPPSCPPPGQGGARGRAQGPEGPGLRPAPTCRDPLKPAEAASAARERPGPACSSELEWSARVFVDSISV